MLFSPDETMKLPSLIILAALAISFVLPDMPPQSQDQLLFALSARKTNRRE